jgi:hypothetical protein
MTKREALNVGEEVGVMSQLLGDSSPAAVSMISGKGKVAFAVGPCV